MMLHMSDRRIPEKKLEKIEVPETIEQRYGEIITEAAKKSSWEHSFFYIQIQILYYLMKIDEKLEHGITTIPEELETSP